jgi:hypothetical protein
MLFVKDLVTERLQRPTPARSKGLRQSSKDLEGGMLRHLVAERRHGLHDFAVEIASPGTLLLLLSRGRSPGRL